MPTDRAQTAKGSYNAQAREGSTAVVNIFHAAPALEIDEDALAEAEALLDGLPVDGIPAPAGLPQCSQMPLRRNPLFVGREADLRVLAATLQAGGTAAVGQVPAVTGLGGLGKSQLASEFVYRYGQFFAGGVFWLSFADPEAIASEIATCGGPRYLNLHRGYDGLPVADQVGLVASAWHSDLPRLLVFDNCEDEELLEAWLPRGGGCRVIVTSRRSDWSAGLGVVAVPLGLLDRPDSIALLRKHRPDLEEDNADLDAIAGELGDLPLALHLAGSFLTRYRHADFGDPARYLEALRSPDLLEHASLKIGGRSPTQHEQNVANTFALSYERLDGTDPPDQLALAVLTRAACFAPGEPIPRALLISSLALAEGDSEASMRAEDALRRLGELGPD